MLKVVKNCCDVAFSINADPVVVYKDERTELFNKIKIANGNFVFLNNIDKTRWLLLQENQEILLALGSYIHYCFEKKCKTAK